MATNTASLQPMPIAAPTDWLGASSQVWWAIQSAQWQALSAWQDALAAMQREWWDEWAAHWAGGAPIGD
jgi:hypothetical protein